MDIYKGIFGESKLGFDEALEEAFKKLHYKKDERYAVFLNSQRVEFEDGEPNYIVVVSTEKRSTGVDQTGRRANSPRD